MKNLFIPALINTNLHMEKLSLLDELPEKIVLAYSVQYKKIAEELMKTLQGKKILALVQVLGCSKPKIPKETESILLVSDGKFHATSLAFETKLPVFVFNNHSLEKITQKDLETFAKKQKASLANYLNAEEIGILVSTKPGQENLDKALKFKASLKNKKAYLFLANNIATSEFENFAIKSWVNTACRRMDLNDARIINIERIINFKA